MLDLVEFYAKSVLIFFINREIVRSKVTTINMVFMCRSLFRFDVGGYIQDLQYSQSIKERHEASTASTLY